MLARVLAHSGPDDDVSGLVANSSLDVINERTRWGDTALDIAAENGDEKQVVALLAHGAEVNSKSADGWTALHFAAFSGRFRVVDLLFETDNDGRTALHYAARKGFQDVVALLLEWGAVPA